MPLSAVIRNGMFLQTSMHPAGLALFPVKRGDRKRKDSDWIGIAVITYKMDFGHLHTCMYSHPWRGTYLDSLVEKHSWLLCILQKYESRVSCSAFLESNSSRNLKADQCCLKSPFQVLFWNTKNNNRWGWRWDSSSTVCSTCPERQSLLWRIYDVNM